jgi:hypothetical protein
MSWHSLGDDVSNPYSKRRHYYTPSGARDARSIVVAALASAMLKLQQPCPEYAALASAMPTLQQP